MSNIFYYESSTISWCEMNYIISSNICEFMNTITGFIYVFNAYKLYNTLKILHGKKYSIKNYNNVSKLEKNHINICVISFFVGLFTVYFHGTLSYSGQILDEFSIYLLIMALDYGYNSNIIYRIIFGLILLNIYSEYNRFKLLLYGIYRSYSLFNSYRKETVNKRKKIFIYGLTCFILSVICWLTDIILCDKIIISIHWIWHILSSHALYFISNYSILNQVGRMDQKPSSYESYLSFLYQSLPYYFQ